MEQKNPLASSNTMSKLIELLRKPYPPIEHRWKAILLSSFIGYLVLVIFQPFGIWAISNNKHIILIGYGLATALSQLIPSYLIPALFPGYHKEQNWTIGKHFLSILILIFFIGVGNWLYSVYIFDWPLRWTSFCIFVGIAYLVGVVPTTFSILLHQNRRLTLHLKEAVEINAHLQQPAAMPKEEEKSWIITFQGGIKESLEVDAEDILYVEADGNYIKVAYRKEGKPVSKLLRATMKQAEEAIAACPFLVKCHRAFLVNIHAVVKVNGNSQGYRLILENCADEVPVSRAYAKDIQTHFNH